jgi:hypothetical protein
MDLAAVWLKVRIDEFAARSVSIHFRGDSIDISLTRSCTLASPACDCKMDPFPPMGNDKGHLDL